MKNLKIGLLSFYNEVYDESLPFLRDRINSFNETIINIFRGKNVEVVTESICRVKTEFAAAVKKFELDKVDAIVTFHLAYSPSLESIEALLSTNLPLIVLNTTPSYNFGQFQKTEEILYNHGIHGVQDMCSLLKRNNKLFFIETGHYEKSDVIERVICCIKAAKMAQKLKTARVGRVGEPFKGMGDFVVPIEHIKSKLGMEIVEFDEEAVKLLVDSIKVEQIDNEILFDKTNFEIDTLSNQIYRKATKSGLIVRKWIEQEDLSALTINFLAINQKSVLNPMPFLEASKAMGRGIGYAGEGDVITAALVGSLLSIYPETSFVEMFCPDWEGDSILLSHMGEMNLNLAAHKPVLKEKEFPYTDADDSVVAYARFKEGEATFIDLAFINDEFSLIIAEGQMLKTDGEDNLKDSIHGWFKPVVPINKFLSDYSYAGGTHHAALVYGKVTDVLVKFAKIMGFNITEIK